MSGLFCCSEGYPPLLTCFPWLRLKLLLLFYVCACAVRTSLLSDLHSADFNLWQLQLHLAFLVHQSIASAAALQMTYPTLLFYYVIYIVVHDTLNDPRSGPEPWPMAWQATHTHGDRP
jgi:hypothetical protein